MFRSITAEFYSSDDAEVASINIKNQIKSVKSIDIINKNNYDTRASAYNNYGYTGLVNTNISGSFLPFTFGLFGMDINNTKNSHNDYNEKGNKVSLKLSCEEKDIPAVSILLSNYGGHNIEKN